MGQGVEFRERFLCEPHLDIRIEAQDAATLTRLQEVVTKHLKQVASKETFEVEWSTSTD